MNRKNLNQALAALADAIDSDDIVDIKTIISNIPKQSLSGDLISGGKITGFASAGITDRSSKEQILLSDDGALIRVLNSTTVKADTVTVKTLTVDTLNVKEIKATTIQEREASIVFSAENNYGKGLLWYSKDYNKQFVFNSNPDRFFSSENIDLGKGKEFRINGVKVLDNQELGANVTKSNLREVGILRGLLVEGDIKLNNYMFYNSSIDRIGLGIENPHAALSVAEMGIEVMLGTDDDLKGLVGTFSPVDFNIVTDNTTRINISSIGNIVLGNAGRSVSIPGKLGVGIKNIDPNVDLHVAGAVRLNNHLQMFSDATPTEGTFTVGDIVWNADPAVGKHVGWVCTRAGNPGTWNPFGEIKDRK